MNICRICHTFFFLQHRFYFHLPENLNKQIAIGDRNKLLVKSVGSQNPFSFGVCLKISSEEIIIAF